MDDINYLESFLTLTTPVTTTAGNAPGKSSYANITGKPSGKKVNVRTLFTPGGNGIDVVVPILDSISLPISNDLLNKCLWFFLQLAKGYTLVSLTSWSRVQVWPWPDFDILTQCHVSSHVMPHGDTWQPDTSATTCQVRGTRWHAIIGTRWLANHRMTCVHGAELSYA
ncbi:hypothetical protein Tco_0778818 [Tanacetum coccineum]